MEPIPISMALIVPTADLPCCLGRLIVPAALADYGLDLSNDGWKLTYTYDINAERKGITALMADLVNAGIRYRDMETQQSSLEEIFVSLVKEAS